MEIRVPLADLDYGEEESQAVLDVLNKRWLTMGTVTQEFESQFAKMAGVKHALAVSNGTAALHLACLILGIGPGDEVILPSLTFVATANAVLYTGAEARFADIIGQEELNISPESIEKQITARTKALILMHYGGYPCRMREILEIAARYNLAVIEDAAHAPGARLEGRALGTWGDVGCFSFFSNKNLVTGEGGMLVTQRDDLAERARLLRSHGMTSLTWERHKGHASNYDVVDLGYNYRIDEMRSALGLVQLSKLDKNNMRRKTITQTYWGALRGSQLGLPFRDLAEKSSNSGSNHIFPVLLPEGMARKAFMDNLRAAGIQTSIHYPPIHQFSFHRQLASGVTLPQTERAAEREVTLPLFSSMSESQVDLVLRAVKVALEHTRSS